MGTFHELESCNPCYHYIMQIVEKYHCYLGLSIGYNAGYFGPVVPLGTEALYDWAINQGWWITPDPQALNQA